MKGLEMISQKLVCGHPISMGDLISCSLLSQRLSLQPLYASYHVIQFMSAETSYSQRPNKKHFNSMILTFEYTRNLKSMAFIEICWVCVILCCIYCIVCTYPLYVVYIFMWRRPHPLSIQYSHNYLCITWIEILYFISSFSSSFFYPHPTLSQHPMKITCGFSFYSVSFQMRSIHDVSSADVWRLKLYKGFPRRALSSSETIFHWFQVFSNEKLNIFTKEDEWFVAGCCCRYKRKYKYRKRMVKFSFSNTLHISKWIF